MKLNKGTYIIDLSKSEEELLSDCDKDTRYCIRRGEKNHIPPTIYENVFVVHLQENNYKPTSMLVFKKEGDTAILLATNTDSQFKNLQGNSYAYWLMIKKAKEVGCKKLDLGGVDLDPTQLQENINNFKQGFGGKLETWQTDVSLTDYTKAKLKKFVKK